VIYGSKYQSLFPGTQISVNAKAAGQFDTVQEGGFLSAGLGGGKGSGVTGFGADLLIIDDPIKGRKDADSETIRVDIQNSLQSDVFTRVHQPNGAIVYVGTRWHWDDPAGFLLENDSEHEWTVLCFPALALVDDPLGRLPGEALWPERYSREYLLSLRNNPAKLGPMMFEALYQQNPTIQSGNIFKVAGFRRWNASNVPKQFDLECVSMDTSFSGGEDNSFTVIQHWGKSGALFYLLDQVRGHWDATQQLNAFRIFTDARPWVAAKLIEKKANGAAIISMLEKWVPGLTPIEPIGSKEQRAQAIEPYVSAGNIFIPETKGCDWVEDFILECAQFNHGKANDQVDTFTQAINWMAKYGQEMLDYNDNLLYAFRQ
jgi:predicted phage terminase large subunit-like protein